MTGMENNGRKCTRHCTPALGVERERGEVPAGTPALVGLPVAVAAGVEVEGECETPLLVSIQCTQLSESKCPCLTSAMHVAHRVVGGWPSLSSLGSPPRQPLPCPVWLQPLLLQKRKLKCICHPPP